MRCDPNSTRSTLGKPDRFGRTIEKQLAAPFCAIKVTGALFHTQGGLAIDTRARVLARNGKPFPNLFAAGGAAVGVSGSQSLRISVGQWTADRDGVRPHRGTIGGAAVSRKSGGARGAALAISGGTGGAAMARSAQARKASAGQRHRRPCRRARLGAASPRDSTRFGCATTGAAAERADECAAISVAL